MTLTITDHAHLRMAQRGFAVTDIELALTIGTEVEGGVFVRDKDCEHALTALAEVRRQIERLRGKRLVCDGEHLVTAYRAKPKKAKSLLRRRR